MAWTWLLLQKPEENTSLNTNVFCTLTGSTEYRMAFLPECLLRFDTLVTTIRRDGLEHEIGWTGRAKALSTHEGRFLAGERALFVDARGGKALFQ